MAPEDRDKDEPSLELPSFGFRRRRSQPEPDEAAPEAEDATEDWAREEVTGPLGEPRTTPADDPARDADRDRFAPVGEGTPALDHEITVVSEPLDEPADEPADEPEDEPASEPTAETQVFEREEVTGPLADPRVLRDAEPTEPAAVGEGQPGVGAPPVPVSVEEDAPTQGHGIGLPAIGSLPAAVVTGVLVGIITVGLTLASLQVCTLVKDTPSCGNPGIFLLLAVFIVMVYLGAALLRAWRVRDPGSTSFLAMGLLAVVVMLFLLDSLEDWWTVIVIPVVGALTFALSQWVTSTFVEPGERPR